jgi:hypothetical protein
MNLDLDLTFTQIVANQLDDYVHAEVLFYPVGSMGGKPMLPLTIGAWLETEWRLNALRERDARITSVLDAAQAEVRKVRTHATELYQSKARREFKSRLDSWVQFLDDHEHNGDAEERRPYNESAGYAAQVHMRFKLELLKRDVPQLAEQLARLNAYDERLREHFKPGRFMWAPELKHAAPETTYWWLYGA